MYDWLAHRARVTPEREALVTADSGNSWDYTTLDETVEEMASRLAGFGVEGGDHLGAVLGTSVEHVCLVHAAMRLGVTLVPLSPAFTPPELRDRLDRADVDAVVCDDDSEQTVVEASIDTDCEESVFTIDEPQWTGVKALSAAEPTTFTPWEWDFADVQLLLFTSGTTGTPKVVQLTMGNLLASAVASAFRLGVVPGDRWLVPLSLHHMGGIAPVLRSTLYGTTTVVREEFDAGGTVDDIQSLDITGVSLVPTMLRRMLSARGTLPDCLRFVLVGGAPCPVELVERCRDFNVPIYPTYGMTETASQVATAPSREAYKLPDSVGRPLLWTDVTVVDDDGDPLPTGESGELVVDGPTVTPGYYEDDAATEAATSPYGFHTGDVGYLDESGRIYVLNRLDDRIVTGGENVDPGEVLDALLDHDDVAEASVVGIPDDDWGERVGALVVPRDEAPLVGELESFLRDRIAGYKLPRTIGFVDALPRTVSGTVERDTVRDRLESGTTGVIEHAEAPLLRRDALDAGSDGEVDDADTDADVGDTDDVGDTNDLGETDDVGDSEGDDDAASDENDAAEGGAETDSSGNVGDDGDRDEADDNRADAPQATDGDGSTAAEVSAGDDEPTTDPDESTSADGVDSTTTDESDSTPTDGDGPVVSNADESTGDDADESASEEDETAEDGFEAPHELKTEAPTSEAAGDDEES